MPDPRERGGDPIGRSPGAPRWDPVWRPRIRPVRVAAVLVAIAVLFVVITPAILTSCGRWLIVRDAPVRAEVAIVLGGGEGERLGAALRIWKQGRIGAIMITGPDAPLLPVYTGEDSLTMGEVKRRIAVRRGVPEQDTWLVLGESSTYEEAVAARRVLVERDVKSAIIVTSPFHSRRAFATFRDVFRGTGIRLSIETLPLDLSEDRVERWWRREHELMSVFTESVKILFYWKHYGIAPL